VFCDECTADLVRCLYVVVKDGGVSEKMKEENKDGNDEILH